MPGLSAKISPPTALHDSFWVRFDIAVQDTGRARWCSESINCNLSQPPNLSAATRWDNRNDRCSIDPVSDFVNFEMTRGAKLPPLLAPLELLGNRIHIYTRTARCHAFRPR